MICVLQLESRNKMKDCIFYTVNSKLVAGYFNKACYLMGLNYQRKDS